MSMFVLYVGLLGDVVQTSCELYFHRSRWSNARRTLSLPVARCLMHFWATIRETKRIQNTFSRLYQSLTWNILTEKTNFVKDPVIVRNLIVYEISIPIRVLFTQILFLRNLLFRSDHISSGRSLLHSQNLTWYFVPKPPRFPTTVLSDIKMP